jgi:ubiquitin conjugation factor E4 B
MSYLIYNLTSFFFAKQVQLDKLIGEKLAIEAALMDKFSIEHTLRFYNLVMLWLIRVALADTVSEEKLKKVDWKLVLKGDPEGLPVLSMPENPPKLFTMIPEWIFDDICEFYLYVLRYCLSLRY